LATILGDFIILWLLGYLSAIGLIPWLFFFLGVNCYIFYCANYFSLFIFYYFIFCSLIFSIYLRRVRIRLYKCFAYYFYFVFSYIPPLFWLRSYNILAFTFKLLTNWVLAQDSLLVVNWCSDYLTNSTIS
jgi:hypothetical protein